MNTHRNKRLDGTFRFLSDSDAPICIATPVAIFSYGIIKKNETLKQNAIYIAESFVVSSIITVGLKYSVNRIRPFNTYSFIEKEASAGSPSFPSGHTSSAFCNATSLSLAFPKWYVIVPSYIWASSVAYSRMHLGVHYPSDVLVGAIIGSGSAYLCYKVNKYLAKRKETKAD